MSLIADMAVSNPKSGQQGDKMADMYMQNPRQPLMGKRGQSAPSDDVEMAAQAAMESDDMSNMFGMEMASDEEHQMLEKILDSVELAIHGQNSGKIEEILKKAPSAYEGVASAAHVLAVASYMQANKQGLQVDPDLYFAENGVIQTTTELVWEAAEAMGIKGIEEEAQFEAALFDTYRRIGETVVEEENPKIVQSAQELMIEMETGEPFDSEAPDDEMVVGPQGVDLPNDPRNKRIPAYEMQRGEGVYEEPPREQPSSEGAYPMWRPE